MGTLFFFSYRGFRIVCTALPTPTGGYIGRAEIFRPGAEFFDETRAGEVRTTDETHRDEQAVIDTVYDLAKAWIDRDT